MARDYYEVLGVGRSATPDEIRRAHRKLAKEHHPDKNKAPEAAKRFAEVQQAYEALSDEAKRAHYDQFGHSGAAGGPFGAGGGGAPGSPFGSGAWQNVNEHDLEEMLGGLGGIGDFFRGPGIGGSTRSRARKPNPRRGENIDLEVTIDFMTAAIGGARNVSVRDESGRVTSIDVKVPAGVPNGGSLRIAGKGRQGIAGGPCGDLLLIIKIAPHPWFTRDGLDISIDVPISIAEAALGTTADIPLLKGTVALRIPPGTSSGKRLRVPGQGIAPASGPAGDFYALIQIVAPTAIGPDEESALRAVAARLPNPRQNRWS